MNIGDKYIEMKNKEDITSLEIYTIDDVYEISLTENVYECTKYKVKFVNEIFKN